MGDRTAARPDPMSDCHRCCRPAGHHGDHCALCLERQDDRRRSCERKRAHYTLDDAQRAASRLGMYVEVYRCTYAKHWHVGHELGVPRKEVPA